VRAARGRLSRGEAREGVSAHEPNAVLRDAYRDDVEARAIDDRGDAARRRNADFVLRTLAAEQQADSNSL
jgi:hypothetical protein